MFGWSLLVFGYIVHNKLYYQEYKQQSTDSNVSLIIVTIIPQLMWHFKWLFFCKQLRNKRLNRLIYICYFNRLHKSIGVYRMENSYVLMFQLCGQFIEGMFQFEASIWFFQLISPNESNQKFVLFLCYGLCGLKPIS